MFLLSFLEMLDRQVHHLFTGENKRNLGITITNFPVSVGKEMLVLQQHNSLLCKFSNLFLVCHL